MVLFFLHNKKTTNLWLWSARSSRGKGTGRPRPWPRPEAPPTPPLPSHCAAWEPEVPGFLALRRSASEGGAPGVLGALRGKDQLGLCQRLGSKAMSRAEGRSLQDLRTAWAEGAARDGSDLWSLRTAGQTKTNLRVYLESLERTRFQAKTRGHRRGSEWKQSSGSCAPELLVWG